MKKYLLMISFAALMIFLAVAIQTRADAPPALSTYLAQEMATATLAVRGIDTSTPHPGPEDQFYFRRFWLRFQARAGFSLPGMLNISVVPEIEMLWERSVPDGWVGYKPPAN